MPGGPGSGPAHPLVAHPRAVDRRAVLGGVLGTAGLLAAGACTPAKAARATSTSTARRATTATPSASPTTSSRPVTAKEIIRREIPVLCWHQLRDWKPSDTGYSRDLLICPPAKFRAQLDALAEGGWHTIGPDAYLDHLTRGTVLPEKPVLLTFDDSQGSQITEALPQLKKRKMTGTFFAMTVVLGNPGWFTRDDLKKLDAEGMTVAAHTWDHHRVDQYSGKDWKIQLEQPRALLEKVVGKPVDHFAYPYGAWNSAALPHVKAAGYKTGFQLADRRPDPVSPLYTLRRSLVGSTWTGPDLLKQLAGPSHH